MVFSSLQWCMLIACAAIFFYIYSNRRKEQEKIGGIKKQRSGILTSDNYKNAYLKLQKVPLLRKYLFSVKSILESYFPGDIKTVHKYSVLTMLGVSCISIVAFATVMILVPTIYAFVCCLILIYVINKEVLDVIVNMLEKTIIQQLNNYVELLQFNFMQTGMIDEAIHDSIVGQNTIVEKHAREILKVLESDDLDRDLSNYLRNTNNPFLKELMCICVTVFLYGDTERDNESSFLYNIKKLKERLGLELENINDISYNFRFHTILTMPPIFLTIYLITWARGTISELEAYYNSFYGFLIKIFIPIVCLVAYFIIKRLKSRGSIDLGDHEFLTAVSNFPLVNRLLTRYYNTNYGKKLISEKMLKRTGSALTVYTLAVKRVLFSIAGFILTFILVIGMNVSTRYRITHEVVGVGSKSSAASEEMSIEMLLFIRAYTDYYLENNVFECYKDATGVSATTFDENLYTWLYTTMESNLLDNDIEISEEQAMAVIKQYNYEHKSSTKLYTAYLGTEDGAIRDDNDAMYELAVKQLVNLRNEAGTAGSLTVDVLRTSVATDVTNDVRDYYNAYLHWYYAILAIIVSIVAFQIPYFWIYLNKEATQQMMQNEVLQFQALILILSTEKQMAPDMILDWMLKFSVVFRRSIHKCVVHLPQDELVAMETLIKDEPFEPFQNLVRSLMMCDRVGVAQAFSSLDVDQKNYIESVQQRTKQRIASNASLSLMIVFGLYGLVMILVMVYPLMTESSGQLTSTMSQTRG